MNPEQFLTRIAKQAPASAYLFLGQEGYQRRVCKTALLDRVLPGDSRASGLTQIDLENTRLPEVLAALSTASRNVSVCGTGGSVYENCKRTRRRFTWPRDLTRSTISCPV